MYLYNFSLLDSGRLELNFKYLFCKGRKGQLSHNCFKQLFFIAKLYETATSFSLQVIIISRATDEWCLLGTLNSKASPLICLSF